MSRQLVTIRTVREVTPIPGADQIETAHIDGWTCVVRKGETPTGSQVVFFEIDSFLPARDERFSFLKKQEREWRGEKGYRLKTIKLRKQLSQGLALPLTLFPEFSTTRPDDLAQALGVKLYEPDETVSLAGFAKSTFPTFIPKTDQERVQNCFHELPQGQVWEVTTKMDGTSLTVFCNEGTLGVCSRNLELKLDQDNQDNLYVKTARETCLLERLPGVCQVMGVSLAIQGEICGPGIQANRAGLPEVGLYLFDVFDITNQRYLGHDDRARVYGLLTKAPSPMPLRHCTTWQPRVLPDTLGELLAMANGPVSPENQALREGLVFKAIDGTCSFKVISNEYLIKHDL
jgi:RNA ligase (TIGR02306 family)